MFNSTMNTSNTTSQYYPSFEFWLQVFGSTMFIDTLYFAFVPLVSLLGFIFNLIGLKVLFNNQFKSTKLYSYLKVYMVNSALVCLASVGIIFNSRRYFNLQNSYFSNFYIVYIYIVIVNTGYFYGGLLDILIILDRIFIIKNKSTLLSKQSSWLICFVLFVVCLSINFPYFFVFYPSSLSVRLSDVESYTFYFFDVTTFAKSKIGTIITFTQYFFRDFFTLASEIILNLLSIYFLRRYLVKKAKMTSASTRTFTNNQPSLKLGDKQNKQNKQDKAMTVQDLTSNNTGQNSMHTLNSTNPKKKNISKSDLKATLMVIIMTILSIMEHSFMLLCLLYFNFFTNLTAFTLGCLANTSVALKHSSNFLIFILFNKNFRNGFISLFKKQ
jgi:hypothetical protein